MSRALTISVKHQDGEWATWTVLEVRVAQPIAVYSDTAGTVSIRGADQKASAPADAS